MDRQTPVVFIHRGHGWYLPYTIHQALHACAGGSVVLLTDHLPHGERFGAARVDDIDRYSSRLAREFVRSYVHMSTHSEAYELFCWLRWFHLLEFMEENGHDDVLYLDSDVMLYASQAQIAATHGSRLKQCAYIVPEQGGDVFCGCPSAHTSYWTVDALADFCRFSIETFQDKGLLDHYRSKWAWHVDHGAPGGVCDMTTLTLFYQARGEEITNWATVVDSSTFDHSMNASSNYRDDEYEMQGGMKRVTIDGGRPYLTPRRPGAPAVAAHTLHFQGRAKRCLPLYYTGAAFTYKIVHDLRWTAKESMRAISRMSRIQRPDWIETPIQTAGKETHEETPKQTVDSG
ncbi:MAG: hypothetical protein ACC645_09375 [Pirellulales bacterium]